MRALTVVDRGGGSSADRGCCPGPLAGVKNLRVSDPTMTSLAVNWDPADGAVRLYKVFYVPVSGGLEEMVSVSESWSWENQLNGASLSTLSTGAGSYRNHQHHPEEPVPRHPLQGVCAAGLSSQRGETPVGVRENA